MSKSGNRTLSNARNAKQDEFYTRFGDIENELKHYKAQLRGKTVFCNCDDPYESNFFKYFALNFNILGLNKLISTGYALLPLLDIEGLKPEGKEPYAIEINEVPDHNGKGATDLSDVEYLLRHDANTSRALDGDETYNGGDFRSGECLELLKQADVVVTNPPFSLFREYVSQLVEYKKQFLIIGNKNAITYKGLFSLIRDNMLWIGVTPMGQDMLFSIPDDYARRMVEEGKEGSNYKVVEGKIYGRSPSIWFTNMDNPKRHEEIALFKKYSRMDYPNYDNYNAIEVGRVADIPEDYRGVMGVPISFLDKYNPEQFELIGSNRDVGQDPDGVYGRSTILNGKETFKRLFIKRK